MSLGHVFSRYRIARERLSRVVAGVSVNERIKTALYAAALSTRPQPTHFQGL